MISKYVYFGRVTALFIVFISGCGLIKDNGHAPDTENLKEDEAGQNDEPEPTGESYSENVTDLGTKPLVDSNESHLEINVEKISAPNFIETSLTEFPPKSLLIVEKSEDKSLEAIESSDSTETRIKVDCRIPKPSGQNIEIPENWETRYGDFIKDGDSYFIFAYSPVYNVSSTSNSVIRELRNRLVLCHGSQSDEEWQKVLVTQVLDNSDTEFRTQGIDTLLMPSGDLHFFRAIYQTENEVDKALIRRTIVYKSGDQKTNDIFLVPDELGKDQTLKNSGVAMIDRKSAAIYLELEKGNERHFYLLRIKDDEVEVKVINSTIDCGNNKLTLHGIVGDKLSLTCEGKFNDKEGLLSLNEDGRGGFLQFQPFFDSHYWGVLNGMPAVTVVDNFGSVGYVATLDIDAGWIKRDFTVSAKTVNDQEIRILGDCNSESLDERRACSATLFSGTPKDDLSILVFDGDQQTLFPWSSSLILKKLQFLQ